VVTGGSNQPLTSNAALEEAAKVRVEQAMPSVVSHDLWPLAGFDKNPPVVDVGCPSGPLPLTSGVPFAGGLPKHPVQDPVSFFEAVGTDAPSYYKTFVFILPTVGDIDSILGGSDLRVAPQEYICGDSGEPGCREVTNALYITEPELMGDEQVLAHWLRQGAGIDTRRD
jgi:hypothetical protein